MSEHTKGSWIYTGNTTISRTDPIFHYASVICGGKRVARATGIGESEAMANARLIATAPDLLELAQNFFEWHANHFDDFDAEVNGQLLSLANDAEAAINKATGE